MNLGYQIDFNVHLIYAPHRLLDFIRLQKWCRNYDIRTAHYVDGYRVRRNNLAKVISEFRTANQYLILGNL